MSDAPDAYCYFQDIAPCPPMELAFERDYLLHAVKGGLDVQVGRERWLLPPSFAAWVPAGTRFEVVISRHVTSCSVLSRKGFVAGFPDHAVAFQMSPMTRAMVRHCRNWGERDTHPAYARDFFAALLATCAELVPVSIAVARPTSRDPRLNTALAFTEGRLADVVHAAEVARAAGLSERSLQRHFAEELGMSWSDVLTRMRMIRAVELLSETNAKVLSIATDCGYSSLSAFNRAFRNYANQTPSAFRQSLSG